MKKLVFIFAVMLGVASCSSKVETNNVTTDTVDSVEIAEPDSIIGDSI